MLEDKITVTPGIYRGIGQSKKFYKSILAAFDKYCRHEWGMISAEDQAANEAAIAAGGRTMGQYMTPRGPIYIITEPGPTGSTTTVLFCNEY